MIGTLSIVGLGPGPARWLTPEASEALCSATDIVGYTTYVGRMAERPGQVRHVSDNGAEIERARHALSLAISGRQVVIVSGGDPGIFAMAAAVFEAIETGPEIWRALDVKVVPGITAMLAAAARIGAPLGSDFCVINLSDNLKPWPLIEKRLALAAEADFVIVLYNPASRARPDQAKNAFAHLRKYRAATTPVIFAAAIGREDEQVALSCLGEADPVPVDMRTLIIIGSSATRIVPRANGAYWVYSPRKTERPAC